MAKEELVFHKLRGDFNGDGAVSILDFPMVSLGFNHPDAPFYLDLNEDGSLSIFDFPIFKDQFGTNLFYDLGMASPDPVPYIPRRNQVIESQSCSDNYDDLLDGNIYSTGRHTGSQTLTR